MYPSGRCVAESIAKLKIAVQWYESGSDDSFKGRNQSQDAVKPHFAGALIRGFECREWAWDSDSRIWEIGSLEIVSFELAYYFYAVESGIFGSIAGSG